MSARIHGQPPSRVNGKPNPEYVRMWKARSPKRAEYLREYNREWRRRNPEKCRGHMRKHKYGVTPDDVQRMLRAQSGKCAICDLPFGQGRREHVDHCHRTGRVRGLLCGPCNRALHHVENETFRSRALTYLKEHSDG